MPSTPKRVLGWTAGQINTAAKSAQKGQRRKAAGRRQQQFLQGGTSHGFWEGRPTDWGMADPKMGIAAGAASWTQVNPARPQRLANQGFGRPSKLAGRAIAGTGRSVKRGVGGLFTLGSDNDPEPTVEPEPEQLALNPGPAVRKPLGIPAAGKTTQNARVTPPNSTGRTYPMSTAAGEEDEPDAFLERGLYGESSRAEVAGALDYPDAIETTVKPNSGYDKSHDPLEGLLGPATGTDPASYYQAPKNMGAGGAAARRKGTSGDLFG